MRGTALFLIATFGLGGVFGEGSASGSDVSATTMEIELVVVAPPGGSVVAHVIEPGGRQRVVAMAERDPGIYGTVFEDRRIDFVVVFEAIGQGQSDPVALTALGLDRALLGVVQQPPTTPTTAAGFDPSVSGWGWLGLAAAAAALSLLAFWAMAGDDRSGARDEEE